MSIWWQTSEVNVFADVGSWVLKFHGLMSTLLQRSILDLLLRRH